MRSRLHLLKANLEWMIPFVFNSVLLIFLSTVIFQSIPRTVETEDYSKGVVLNHLYGVSHSLKQERAAERMQKIFPEGACFILSNYGFAWANALPHLDSNLREEGLQEIRYALDRLNEPLVTAPFSDTQVRKGVFWLGQRNLLLGRYLEALIEDDRPIELVEEFHQNSDELGKAFEKSPTYHLDSYPNQCWPIDNTTALRSIIIHDELYGTQYREVYDAWKLWTNEHLDPSTQLPAGHMSSQTGYLLEPARGCVMSFMVTTISEIDSEYAAELYVGYKKHFAIDRMGYRMFREWPVSETKRGSDVDSGPIIWGAGVTATGVGLAAARSQGDREMEASIRDLSRTLGFPSLEENNGKKGIHYLFGQLPVGDSFLAWGYSIERPSNSENASEIPSIFSRILMRWPWYLSLFSLIGLVILRAYFFWKSLKKKYLSQSQRATSPENQESIFSSQ